MCYSSLVCISIRIVAVYSLAFNPETTETANVTNRKSTRIINKSK